MQYGMGIKGYKRSDRDKNMKNNAIFAENALKLSGSFFASMLICRVTLNLSITNLENIAPFGLAFLMALITVFDKKYILAASMGGLIGYFSLINITDGIAIYIISVMLICLIGVVPIKLTRKKILAINLISIFLTMLVYRSMVEHFTIGSNIIISFIQTLILIPLYYTIRYGMLCINEVNPNYAYSNEELISLSIITMSFPLS